MLALIRILTRNLPQDILILYTLPPNIILVICIYLNTRSLVRFIYVCKYFYCFAKASSLSLDLDKLLSVFVFSVSGFKRQLLLLRLVVYS
jgi:hypothetical protein